MITACTNMFLLLMINLQLGGTIINIIYNIINNDIAAKVFQST